MKHLHPIYILTVLLRSVYPLSAQPNFRQAALDSAANFYQVSSDFHQWIDTVELSDSAKSVAMKQFGRWASFWWHRVQCEDTTQRGLFSMYQNALGISWITPSCTGVDDAGWESFGPYPDALQDMGLIQAIWFEKTNPDTILVGSGRTGGILKSVDRGNTWYDVLSPTRIPAYGISSFAVSPARDPNTHKRVIYASTGSDKVGYSVGILKSVDGGETWSILEDFLPYYNREFHMMVKKIVVYHQNGIDHLYAIASNHLFISTNGGLTWGDWGTIPGADDYVFNDIEICPNNKDIFVISGIPIEPNKQDPPLRAKVWITYQGGINFSEILGNSGYNLVHQVTNVLLSFPTSGNLYIHTSAPSERKIMLFEHATSAWTIYSPNYKTGIGLQFNLFEVAENNPYFYLGTETFSISSTIAKGSELIPYGIYAHTHPDIRCMDFYGEIIMLGSDGGVIYSNDHGNSWQSLNGQGIDGLTNNEVIGMDITDDFESEVVAGLFDNNFKHYRSQKWHSAIPTTITLDQNNGLNTSPSDIGIGDVGRVKFDADNPDEIIMMNIFGLAHVTRNGNDYAAYLDWKSNTTVPYAHWWNAALERLKSDPDKVLFGGWNGLVYISSDGGYSFSNPGIQLPGANADVIRIKISPVNPQIIYALTSHITYGNPPGYALYRSENGGTSWTDITGGSNINTAIRNQGYSVTDFTIDWHNPDRVWVCMGGISMDSGGSPYTKERVYTTFDASQGANTQWVDISLFPIVGLPPLPISAIANQPGTSRVFVASDGGIFYRDDNDAEWICYSNGFPITHVTDLKINPASNEIFASTFGYSILKSPLPCDIATNPASTEIDATSGNVTWSNQVMHKGDIYVRSNYTLTIDENSVIYMHPNSSIFVETGAKLIVNNATLTSCEEMWQGIKVDGDKSQHQNGTLQGTIILENGATIANARVGVETGNNDLSGGIIQAENSYFYNCEYAVKMYPYQNFNPNNQKPLPESGKIINCTFRTTEDLHQYGLKPKSFIYLNGIHHINILGNSFENSNINETNLLWCGKGIECYNSQINVSEICQTYGQYGCTQWIPNTFKRLQTGIYALATQPNLPLNINLAEFYGNHKGVYLNGISGARVKFNRFDVKSDENLPDKTYGVYLDHCTGYAVEENHFEGDPNNTQITTLGMVINNSGEETNEVYNNSFNDLIYGLIAQHDNRGIDENTGFKIKCNDFSDVLMTDIGITKENWYTRITGISKQQGSDANVTSSAGNTFSWKNFWYYSDINNNGLNISKYYHHDIQGSTPAPGENWVPLYYNSSKVILENAGYPYVNKTTVCPSHSGGNGLTLAQLYLKVASDQVEVNSAKLVLDIWKDGGIPDLPVQVVLAYPWETYYYYNLLMLESPYLSDQTLIAAINNTEMLPDLLLKLILIANPQCTRSGEVLQAIEERDPQLPEYMIEEIMLGEDVASPLEALEATVSYHTHERQNALNRIATIYLNDTVNSYARDSLTALFDRDEYLNAKYAKAFIHLYDNDFEALDTQLSDIEAMTGGEEYYQEEYQEYMDYIDIARVMHEDSLSYDDLTTSQKDMLHNLAENGRFFPAAYARSLLICYDPEFEYEEPIALPVIETYRKRGPVHFFPDTTDCSFAVYPNPALDYVILDYRMQQEDVSAIIQITDSKGRLIKQIQLDQPVGQHIVGCRELSPGLYQFTLVTKRKIVMNRKVTIAK